MVEEESDHGRSGIALPKSPMARHFRAETRAEVIELADKWWKAQKGLRQTLRLVSPGDDKLTLGKRCCWKAVIHFEKQS